jgi:hypothetical protein
MYYNAEDDSESAKSGETDDLARVRIPPGVADKALFHVAGVNPFGVAVANAYNLAQIDFVDPKAVISGIDDPAMVISSMEQLHRNVSPKSQILQSASDFQRLRVRA